MVISASCYYKLQVPECSLFQPSLHWEHPKGIIPIVWVLYNDDDCIMFLGNVFQMTPVLPLTRLEFKAVIHNIRHMKPESKVINFYLSSLRTNWFWLLIPDIKVASTWEGHEAYRLHILVPDRECVV